MKNSSPHNLLILFFLLANVVFGREVNDPGATQVYLTALNSYKQALKNHKAVGHVTR